MNLEQLKLIQYTHLHSVCAVLTHMLFVYFRPVMKLNAVYEYICELGLVAVYLNLFCIWSV